MSLLPQEWPPKVGMDDEKDVDSLGCPDPHQAWNIHSGGHNLAQRISFRGFAEGPTEHIFWILTRWRVGVI